MALQTNSQRHRSTAYIGTSKKKTIEEEEHNALCKRIFDKDSDATIMLKDQEASNLQGSHGNGKK
ncbi:MAG: hypothetical protein U5K00_05030 [Melioribacteraceae bacterium]|nr:hypothetical protein [Melioribacteraceae bacterium]